MTDKEIQKAFDEQRETIEQAEEYLVRFIRNYLLSDDQKKRLYELNIGVADLVNGRYSLKYSNEMHSWFKEWNRKIGRKYFIE